LTDKKELEKSLPITEWFEIERRMAIISRMTTTESSARDNCEYDQLEDTL
jgi:hypothetical protein